MSVNVFPTKSNLMAAKRSLELAVIGYELLDRKRNIMLREMMSRMDEIEEVQSKIDDTFSTAYLALQKANVSIGQQTVQQIADTAEVTDDVTLRQRSIMGVEIPEITLREQKPRLHYGFHSSSSSLDDAYLSFIKVKELVAKLAAIENSVYRLAHSIKQAQKRANALKNIVIPDLEDTVHYITGYLEEKERESFSTLKVIKRNKEKAGSK
ncbi:MAG: V-type ATP synthase subunit D [Eubacteriales bacterium]